MPQQGEILGGTYEILGELGAGGVGVIYLAWHRNLGKYVVVKRIRENFLGVLNERGEADILKKLHHSYLPQVYDFLQIGRDVYTVMEYIEGHDLQYYLKQGYGFGQETILLWLSELAEVLGYLHARGILHLDIKPANIMVTPEGHICLIDFNVSLAEDESSVKGYTLPYASPEQCRMEAVDGRSDIYSLGVVFAELMEGGNYPDNLWKIIRRMEEPEKEKRYGSAAKLLRAIEWETRSRAEKKTLGIVFYGMLGAVCMMILALGILLYRNKSYVNQKTREAIQQEDTYLAALCQKGEYEEAYESAVSFCNTEAGALEKLPGAYESIREKLVDACIGEGRYSEARSYLSELLEREEKAVYQRKLAITLAYLGEYEAAEAALTRAKALGDSEEELTTIRAELKASEGKYGEAAALYETLPEDTGTLRRKASLSLLEAEKGEAGSGTYAEQAAGYYERLAAKSCAGFTDELNLVSAWYLCGKTEKAIQVLRGMESTYPERYEVYLTLGILRYNQEMKKTLAERDLSEARTLAEKAEKLYENTGAASDDEKLSELLELTKEK